MGLQRGVSGHLTDLDCSSGFFISFLGAAIVARFFFLFPLAPLFDVKKKNKLQGYMRVLYEARRGTNLFDGVTGGVWQ